MWTLGLLPCDSVAKLQCLLKPSISRKRFLPSIFVTFTAFRSMTVKVAQLYLLLGRKAMTNLLLLLLLSRVSRVRLCATPETAAHQAPLSLGFSRQEQRSGLPFSSPMHESEK